MPIQRRTSQTDEAPPAETTRETDDLSGYRRIPSAPRQTTQIGVAPPHRQVTQPMMHAVPVPRPRPSRPAIRRVDTPARLAAASQPRTTTQRIHVPTAHAADPPGEGARHATLKMGAVRPEARSSSGRMLDELDFYDGDPAVALELGAMPAGHVPTQTMAGPAHPVVHFRPRTNTVPVPSPPATPPRAAAAVTRSAAFDPRPGIAAFAGFGFVPDNGLRTPRYALNVLLRSFVLRRELARTRVRRPQDVWLYKAALRCGDGPSFAKGIFLLSVGGVAVLATLVGLGLMLLSS